MKIHSSSLAYPPTKAEAKKKNENHSSTQNEDSLKASALNTAQSQKQRDDTFKPAELDRLSNNIKNLNNNQESTASSRAVNAYIQENTQLLKNQRTELISRVDFYI